MGVALAYKLDGDTGEGVSLSHERDCHLALLILSDYSWKAKRLLLREQRQEQV